ncbi:uncharacterized protein LOC100577748 isoform X3 [Apis mellifera]|uniref:Uncharacterized protein LOC100577748 isoform X3 n=1 Tax=Apis mellifera TaxID=7460 RepID=A0A7M7GEM1_APIME|nr:uncharacterized protein LOC100577748 isoform X3 [Apis mellifera]|eukprot:XP_003250834.2 uncharacterized protein LOC100577748 isoform X3 [Apis mellifera]
MQRWCRHDWTSNLDNRSREFRVRERREVVVLPMQHQLEEQAHEGVQRSLPVILFRFNSLPSKRVAPLFEKHHRLWRRAGDGTRLRAVTRNRWILPTNGTFSRIQH